MPSPVVVLVDDVPELGLIVGRFGRRCGYTVVHFLRAEDAWDYLQREKAVLVLLDINLPGMSGLAFRQLLRATPELARLPVALLSSRAQLDELENETQGDFDFVLNKDLLAQPEAWQRRLDEILHKCRDAQV
jgi:CheY-like chemotaxis protein